MKLLLLAACLTLALASDPGAVPCDDSHECADGQTCCKLSSGDWGCCPLPKATCCNDHVHCCPNGYTCDVADGRCLKGEDVIAWVMKQAARSMKGELRRVKAVQCDDSHECADGQTCCKLASGDWGCCPLPEATCCDDHVHCCPHGYKCDVADGRCLKGTSSLPFLIKQAARTIHRKHILRLEAVQCDDSHECADGQTCCKLASGDWGCCPLPKATCCNDHVHCCPNGYTCDVADGRCLKGVESLPWVLKKQARHSQPRAVPCDESHECENGQTCCKLSSGDWGCCPLPKAVCCDDHVHCCPNGYTCDVADGRCNKGQDILPWLEKRPAHTRA